MNEQKAEPPAVTWVVLIRVDEKSRWAVHGPFDDHLAAHEYSLRLAGTGMERQITQLLKPWKPRINAVRLPPKA